MAAVSSNKIAITAFHGFLGSGHDFKPLATRTKLYADWVCPDWICNPTFVCSKSSSKVFLGYSMGGRFALKFVQEKRPDLKALILVGTCPGLDGQEKEQRHQKDLGLIHKLEVEGVHSFVKYWQSLPLIRTQRERIPSILYYSMLRRRFKLSQDEIKHALETWSVGKIPSLWSSLSKIKTPVYYFVGKRDAKYREIALEVKRQIPRCKVIIVPKAGHMVHLENINYFASALKSICQS